MKKEKKVKFYFTESDSRTIKTYCLANKMKYWNGTNHFQFDFATAVITAVAVGAIILILAAANGAFATAIGLAAIL
jgi:hypothetical protein